MIKLCLKLACLSFALLACFGLSHTAKADTLFSGHLTTGTSTYEIASANFIAQSFTTTGGDFNKIDIKAMASHYIYNYDTAKIDVRICKTYNCGGAYDSCANNDSSDCQIKNSFNEVDLFGSNVTSSATTPPMPTQTITMTTTITLLAREYYVVLSVDNNGSNGAFYLEYGDNAYNGCYHIAGASGCYAGTNDIDLVLYKDNLTPTNPDTQTPIIFNDNYSLYTNSTGLARFSYSVTEFASSSDYLTLYKCGSLPLGTLGDVSCAGATNLGTSSIWTSVDKAFNSPSGNGILSITSTSSERTLYYVIPTKTGSTNLYYPVYFYVSWNNGTPLDPNDFIGTTSTSSLEKLLGMSTYKAACTEEEWNATSTFLGLNGTLLRCSITKAGLDLGNVIGRIPTNVANGFIDNLQNLFPFNIPIKIKQSFDSSTSTLPVALNYFNIADANGNLAITLPEEWVGSTTPVAVWGPGVMTENESASNFFAGIKAFSTYIMWFMFITYIWHKALDIKEEATLERMPPTPGSYPKENYRY